MEKTKENDTNKKRSERIAERRGKIAGIRKRLADRKAARDKAKVEKAERNKKVVEVKDGK